jgi:hypothetical protein
MGKPFYIREGLNAQLILRVPTGFARSLACPAYSQEKEDRGDRVRVTVLLNLSRLALSFPGVASSIPNPVLHLGIPVLCVLCELIGVTVSPKWDLGGTPRRASRQFLVRSLFPHFFALSSLFLGTRTIAVGFLL